MPVELSLGRRAPAVIIIARVESVLGCPVIHFNLPLAEPDPPDPSGLMLKPALSAKSIEQTKSVPAVGLYYRHLDLVFEPKDLRAAFCNV